MRQPEMPAPKGESLYSKGKIFAVAPMIDWTDLPENKGLQDSVGLL
jgi:hypothetical protein